MALDLVWPSRSWVLRVMRETTGRVGQETTLPQGDGPTVCRMRPSDREGRADWGAGVKHQSNVSSDYQRARIAHYEARAAAAPLGMPKPKPARAWPKSVVDQVVACLDAGVTVPMEQLTIAQEFVGRFGGHPHPHWQSTLRNRAEWARRVNAIETAVRDAFGEAG